MTLQKLNAINKDLEATVQSLARLQAGMSREKQQMDAARKTKQELDLKQHEIHLTEEQINGNAAASIIHALNEMREGIEKLNAVIVHAKAVYDEATRDAKRIEKDMADFSKNKDSKLVELQKELEKLKKSLTKETAAIKPLQQEVRDAMLESEQCGADLAAVRLVVRDVGQVDRHRQEPLRVAPGLPQ